MSQLTIRKTWNVNGVLTNPSSITLGIVQGSTGTTIVAAGTAMNQVATGIYEYTVNPVDGGTTYTATIVVVYGGETYTFGVVAVPEVTPATVTFPDSLNSLLAQLTALYAQITLSPKPTYSVHGHNYAWGEYLAILGAQIEQLTKIRAQQNPFEIVSRGN